MDNKNQQYSGSTHVSGAPATHFETDVRASPDPEALSKTPTQPTFNAAAGQKGDTFWIRLVKRADVILAVLLVMAGVGLFLIVSQNEDDEPLEGPAGRFNTVNVPLEDLAEGETIDFGDQQVIINGSLQANGNFILTPSDEPTDAVAGQIYYDQTSNVLTYYNGVEFVTVGGGVASLQGQGGDITLSGAGGITVTDDGAGNITLTGPGAGTAGVTSLNGLTGGLTVADASSAGSTITINDATTASKGIASFNANNFSVSGGAVNTVQNINTAAAPTFAGVNTNTIQGGGSLSLLSGGNVAVGTTNATGTLLVVDTKTSAGDPTGVDGAIYYNSNSGNFRCFQGGSWTNCITASGGFVSLQNAYDNSTPAVINLNATNDGILVRDTAGGIGGNLFAVQNSTGSATYFGVTTSGITTSGNATVQGGTLTAGTTSQAGSLVLHAGNTFAGTLQVASVSQNTVYTLPDPSQGTATICLSTGNCAGAGSGVTSGGGTTNRLAKFTSGQNIEDSTITDDGSTVTTSVDMVIQGGNLTVGVAGSQSGSLVLAHSNGQATTLQAGASTGDLTFVLPAGAGNQFQCLKKDTGNQLIWDDCEGGGGGVTTTFQQVYNASNPATFTLDATNGGLTIRDNVTPIGANLFAIQNSDGSATYLAQTTSALTLGTNVDLLLQGATAFISNPQTQTNSEAFGLNASVTGSNAVAVGNGASAGGNGIGIGNGATANSGIAIGVNALADSGNPGVAIGNSASTTANDSVAIGHGATAALRGTAVGEDANASAWGIALGRFSVAGQRQFVAGANRSTDSYIDQVYLGQGSQDSDVDLGTRSITINATGGSGTNLQGMALNLAGGRSTGNAAGGGINLQVSLPGGSGTALNSLTTALNVSGSTGAVSLGTSGAGGLNGQLAWRNTTTTNTITVQGEVATANQTITLPNATGTVCLTSGNCAGVGGTGDVLQNGNSFGTTMTLGTNDNFNFGLETRGTTWVTLEGTALQADLAPRVVFASNVDLIMQGATAYISNPMNQTSSEGFGLNVTMSGTEAVAFGNGAIACNSSVAIGFSAETINCGSGGVAIGHNAGTNGGSVAVGQSAGTGTNGVAIGNTATGSGDSISIGHGAASGANAVTIGAGSSTSTGAVAIGDTATVATNGGIAIGLGATIGTNAVDSIVIGEGATASGSAQSNHLVVGSNLMPIQQGFIGNGITNATPQGFTLNSTGGSGTNIAGANLTLAGGRGTGSANGGNINFQVTFGGQGSGTTPRTLQTVGTFSGVNGALTLQNAVDSATAFRVLNQAGTTTALSVDTTATNRVLLGTNTDLILQGATAFISNPQGQTNGEAFGLNATVTSSNALAVGSGASAGGQTVAVGTDASGGDGNSVVVGFNASAIGSSVVVGFGASAQNGAVVIGSQASANSTFASGAVIVGNDASIVTDAQSSTVVGGGAVAGTRSIALGHDADASQSRSIAIGASATTTTNFQLVVGGSTSTLGYINHAYFGSGVTDATPQNITLHATGGSGTDISGATMNVTGGIGTGTGVGGDINLQVSAAGGSTGATPNSLTTVLTANASTRTISVALSNTASTAAVCSSLGVGDPVAGSVYELQDCDGTPQADYAEMYPVSEDANYGDIVAMSDELVQTLADDGQGNILHDAPKKNINKLIKATSPYQTNVVGIVSNNYGDFSSTGHNVIDPEDNPMPVALNGRVPVKISPDSSPIAIGDYITTSDAPGKGMRVNEAGFAIGKALEAWTPESGKETIMVFVEQGYYPGVIPVVGHDLQSGILNINVNDLVVSGNLEVTGAATFRGLVSVEDIVINGHIAVGSDTAGTVVIPSGQTQTTVTFSKPYDHMPVITTGTYDFVMVRLRDVTPTGFTIAIPESTDRDIRINWTALETE